MVCRQDDRIKSRAKRTGRGTGICAARGHVRCQERGIEFISLTEQIDTTTPGDKLIFHLMGALAEFERDLIRERTNAGLAAPRARGHVDGRRRKLKTNGKVALARRIFDEQSHSISEICAALGISRATLYRYVKEATSSVSDS